MNTIGHDKKMLTLSEPHSFIIYHNGPDEDVFYYLYLEIVYDFLNKVQYTTLEHILKRQSCSTIQFHKGYHTGGKIIYIQATN